MGKKLKNVPDWCKVLGKQLSSGCMSSEGVIEAIKLDIDMVSEEYARRKWERIAEEKKEKR